MFLLDNIKLDGIPAKIKWKVPTYFTLYFKFSEGSYFCEKLYDTATSYVISYYFTSVFIVAVIIFCNFLELHSSLSEKRFLSQIFLVTNSPKAPHPLKAKTGGAWEEGGLKMVLKNTREGVHLSVKLPVISLQACKFTKNELLYTKFSMILGRF